MGVLPDWMIGERVHINPKAQQDDREGVISYGVSSYGYDARLGRKFKICNTPELGDTTIIDPKNIDRDVIFTDHEGSSCIIPPHGFILGETVETFKIPRDCIAICVGKSTYARCGIIVNVTPLEPEWKGKITIEISNTTPFPVKVYANEGIMQVLFLTGASTCDVSYADKGGKYQGQRGVTLPIVK